MRDRRRDYELMFIVSPLKSSEEEVNTTLTRLTNGIAALGGEVVDFNHAAPWGRRKFAYPIRAYAEGEASRRIFTEGYYILCHFRLPTTQLTEFERTLKLNDAVLRYMLTLVDTRGAQAQAVPASADASDADANDSTGDDGE
jgi:small subunit ribosomal protein S6